MGNILTRDQSLRILAHFEAVGDPRAPAWRKALFGVAHETPPAAPSRRPRITGSLKP